MAICAADMNSCKPKKKCLFGPNEGAAYLASDPCCGAGDFNPQTCDCDLGTGVYRIGVTVSEGIDTGAFRYSYFKIGEPYFSEGRPVRISFGIGSTNWSNRDDIDVGNQGCYDAGQCSNIGQELTAFAVYEEPCWFTAPDSTYIYRSDDPSTPNGMAVWWTPPEYGRGICPSTCTNNPNYNAPEGFPFLRIFKYFADNNQIAETMTFLGSFEPSANRLQCPNNLRVFYSTDGPEYVGPGDLADYFESTPSRPVYDTTLVISEDEVFEPDFYPSSET